MLQNILDMVGTCEKHFIHLKVLKHTIKKLNPNMLKPSATK